MDKNEVYDYLAKVYFDRKPQTSPGKKKGKYYLFILIGALIVAVSALAAYIFLSHSIRQFKPKQYSLYFSTGNNLIKLDYNFTASEIKKAGYTTSLPDIDVSGFGEIVFAARRMNKSQPCNVRIEIETKTKETSGVYFNGITERWFEHTIKLSDFKGISDLSGIRRISFIVEEWNVADKIDTIYIDDVRFSKSK